MMRILALDQGTTSTRLLAAQDGKFALIGQLRHETRYPAPGWVEQDPLELLENCRKLVGAAGPAAALGLANQGESCLAWDGITGAPLSPVIVWQDRRTLADLAMMVGEGLGREVEARAGLPLDPYFSAAKLGWLLRNVPGVAEARARGRLCLGTTDAFLLHRLTGHFATDCATASRTSLMTLSTGEWDADLCRMFGVPLECLPEIRSNISGFGQIGGVPVTAAIVDQQAALYGHGCRRVGDTKVTFGTGAFALTIAGLAKPIPAGGVLPTVAWDLGHGMVYALDAGVQDAGSAVEWALRAGIARDLADFDNFPDRPAIERGLVFLPLFSGLGAPYWDRSAAPLILGLGPEMTQRDLCQALVEGVAFQIASLLDVIDLNVPGPKVPSVDGGLSASRYFMRFLARISQRTIAVPDFSERTAFGAASLAALALGVDLAAPDPSVQIIEPEPQGKQDLERFQSALSRSRGWREP